MDVESLEKWLKNNGSYKDGVAIYNAIGKNLYYKNTLFKNPESRHLYSKLKDELGKILKEIEPVLNVPVIEAKANNKANIVTPKREKKGLSSNDFFNLPRHLQESRLEISKLYSEAQNMRRLIKRELNMPSKGSVSLQEAFQIMNQTVSGKNIPFTLGWITYNQETDLGGDYKELDCVIKWGNKTGSKFKHTSAVESKRRDARHDIHGTFNVQIVNTIEVRTVHTWLMFYINGLEILL